MSVNIQNLRFLNFLAKIVYPNYNSSCFVLYMLAIYNRVTKLRKRFEIKAASSSFIRNTLTKNSAFDLNNTIIVDRKTVDNYIKLVVITTEINGAVFRRKVRVIGSNLEQLNTILVTPTLLHNLRGACVCNLKICKETCLNFADKVEVSLINTWCDWGNAVTDQILKSYFSTPKIIYSGDIIEIPVQEYGKEIFYSKKKFSSNSNCIFCKCNEVFYKDRRVSGGFLCLINETTLKQAANIQSFIPKLVPTIDPPLCPYGLSEYLQDMQKALRPFVHKSRIKLKPMFLLQGNKGSGKGILVESLASSLGMHLNSVYNFDVSANIYAQTEVKVKNLLFNSKMSAPCIVEIRNFENFGKNNEGQYDERIIDNFVDQLDNFFSNNEFPVAMVCSSNEEIVPVELRRVFLKSFNIKAPNDEQRSEILRWILEVGEIQSQINFDELSSKTHGFFFEDLRTLIYHAVTNCNKENVSALNENHLAAALDFMQANYNQSLGAAKVPKVQWSDVGGLNDVKEEIIKLIKLPLTHPKLLKATGLKRSGVLLYGPPGTGKTLIAKAVATECGLCFLSVKGPELLNMYVGQSEQNVREVFERAREASPCIIFFDELDSLAPNRGASNDSGGVMDRVVSQLLAEMDGLNRSATIFIIGATNRPDLIDPALLRPGRFDKLLYVGPCSDKASKISVLAALTRKFKFEDDVSLDEVVELCPENLSGADFYGICSKAWMEAARRLVVPVESNKSGESGSAYDLNQNDVKLTMEDFKLAIVNIKPSITPEDLQYFQQLRSSLG